VNSMIDIQNLVRRFGSFTAVKNISFNVQQGEIFGFLGANGAGKTTTIRMICGLLRPSSGDILVDGLSVSREPEKIKRRIGYMSQKFSLYSDLTPSQNIDFFASVYKVNKTRVKEIKELLTHSLDMKNLNSIVSGELPLGMKQRLGLQCALLHDPPVIFLDEPTSGVDPLGRREFWDTIYQLSHEGKTVLVTTHFMDEAEYCDRVAVMNHGRLIELSSPDELKNKYERTSMNDVFIAAVEKDRKEVL